ncbi:hypothetical protein [Rodentibacter haemolyticus]|uniref:Prophage protein n=1 Tax=Rodentibacter haemolyticus TaxID=2778911 RepID=A0ABX6UZJ8_9PAST|nr:hypothetical protein [Rodentibacter haemolyticus]QPB42671.1 hypothetical protein IHV77_00650 [Rodentibacter haemolyticus]
MRKPTYLITEFELKRLNEIQSLLLFTARSAEKAEPFDIESALNGILSLVGETVESIREHCEVKGGNNA